MIPVATDQTTGTLYLNDDAGNRVPGADLPFERLVDERSQHLFETTWIPDDGERKALANGAPVLLRVWGAAHPPVKVLAGEPGDGAEALVARRYAARALAFVVTRLQTHVAERGEELAGDPGSEDAHLANVLPEPEEVLGWWERGLEIVAEAERDAEAALRADENGTPS